MNPVLKYRGGKSREILRFLQYIPDNFNRYIEPFFGGGAVFFYLEPDNAIINDLNGRLMMFYQQLRDDYPAMRIQLDELQRQYEVNQAEYKRLKALSPDERVPNANEDLYYKIRELFNHPDDSFLDGVLYFFINKTAYSGMIRYNNSGEYNVPFGRYPNLNTHLVTAQHSELLQRAELFNMDYRKIFDMAGEDDFIFLDPPYDCIFNDYGNIDMMNGFDETEHRRLAEDFRNLSCRALMVIGKTPLTEELYSGYIFDEYYKNYAVNIRNRFKNDKMHVVVSLKNKDFSARDRITRSPKALGFVDLKPYIELTEAGNAFVYSKRPQEVFLRQLLKFQLPSPYHVEADAIGGTFFIKPYLEIMRLVRDLESLSFDELKIFALMLTDYREYEVIKNAILKFRVEKEAYKGRYKKFVDEKWTEILLKTYASDIDAGKTKTRETVDGSLKKFISTKKNNARDYTDACFRYLRYTSLVSVSYKNHSISFYPDKLKDVDFILKSVERKPVYIDDIEKYKEYLFNASKPVLYIDNRNNVADHLMRISEYTQRQLSGMTLDELKDLRDSIVAERKKTVINEQVIKIKSYALYSEIIDTFNEIISDGYYDAPLMLEYNTWRAMTMLDGGEIKGNFNFDDIGQPLSTAAGNMPDIECDYRDYALSVEVTMQSGQKQYESEGEPVARHLGYLKKGCGKETYCLFIAPTINSATLAHFYGLNHIPIALYGGKTKIIPLDLDQFMRLVENSYNYTTQPKPVDVRKFLDSVIEQGDIASDENDWKERIQKCVDEWLVV